MNDPRDPDPYDDDPRAPWYDDFAYEDENDQ